ncbi:ubiquitin-conjugating enzyme E2 2-like [Molossus molossus]|uniref:ubiquitin-conjugating enzyme E2 2-like n=1 Tax=Molossus molossus TaxID=27622 RepID=UPI001746E38D|nr:ubiquitin-conjugating enzyme E2 2-like [Molossus molossus]
MAQSRAVRRLLKEFLDLSRHPPELCSAGPLEDDILTWQGVVIGPQGSPYEGGIFSLEIVFPATYPLNPPQVQFSTPIYHPNVSESGCIGLDLLTSRWAPTCTISQVLLAIGALLADPSPHDILDPEIANVFLTDRPEFDLRARKWTEEYAM